MRVCVLAMLCTIQHVASLATWSHAYKATGTSSSIISPHTHLRHNPAFQPTPCSPFPPANQASYMKSSRLSKTLKISTPHPRKCASRMSLSAKSGNENHEWDGLVNSRPHYLQDTAWTVLLALMWPVLVTWSTVLTTARALEAVSVAVQQFSNNPTSSFTPSITTRITGLSEFSRRLGLPLLWPAAFAAASSSSSFAAIDWAHLQLQVKLHKTVCAEDYSAACAVKAQLLALQEFETNIMAAQLLNRSTCMRKALTAIQHNDSISALQARIEEAVREQDFSKALQLHNRLLELAPPPSPPNPRPDLEYLEWDAKKRVAEAWATEQLLRRDPVVALNAQLSDLLAEENFEEAARVNREIQKLQRERDENELMQKLDQGLKKQRQNELKIEGVNAKIERIQRNKSEFELRAAENSIVDFKPLFMSFDFSSDKKRPDSTTTLDRGN